MKVRCVTSFYRNRHFPSPRTKPTSPVQASVWRQREPMRAPALTCVLVILVAGCGPSTAVHRLDGMALVEVRRGICFVGCGIKARFPNGTRCNGFAVSMDYDRRLTADIYCPDAPTALLQVDKVSRTGSSLGTLRPGISTFSNETIDIDAIIDIHVPYSEE